MDAITDPTTEAILTPMDTVILMATTALITDTGSAVTGTEVYGDTVVIESVEVETEVSGMAAAAVAKTTPNQLLNRGLQGHHGTTMQPLNADLHDL